MTIKIVVLDPDYEGRQTFGYATLELLNAHANWVLEREHFDFLLNYLCDFTHDMASAIAKNQPGSISPDRLSSLRQELNEIPFERENSVRKRLIRNTRGTSLKTFGPFKRGGASAASENFMVPNKQRTLKESGLHLLEIYEANSAGAFTDSQRSQALFHILVINHLIAVSLQFISPLMQALDRNSGLLSRPASNVFSTVGDDHSSSVFYVLSLHFLSLVRHYRRLMSEHTR